VVPGRLIEETWVEDMSGRFECFVCFVGFVNFPGFVGFLACPDFAGGASDNGDGTGNVQVV